MTTETYDEFMRRAGLILSILLAATFVASAVVKLIGPYAFYDAILGYRIVGATVARLMVFGLPTLELLIAAALLSRAWRNAGAMLAAGLGVVFVVAQASVLIRGIETACGCFGTSSGSVGAGSMIRALIVVGMGLGVWILESRRTSRANVHDISP